MTRVCHHLGNMLLVLVTLVIGVVLAEGAAQLYAHKVVKLGKLFRPDDQLGWAPLPNLDLVRNNHNGEPWLTRTNEEGLRGPSEWSETASRRMLILGDSFAFGEGVNIEDRFDTLIGKQFPDLSIINLGVMGYGTDQQAIKLRAWEDDLRPGDILLVLTYSNDFFDIVSTTHSGRSKPWFSIEDGELIEHDATIGLLQHIRDRSYLLARLASRFNSNDETRFQNMLGRAGELYERIVADEIARLTERGVDVVIVHHGDDVLELPFDVDAVLKKTCRHVTSCLALDPYTDPLPEEVVFLSDGHWAAGGHAVAAEHISDHLAGYIDPRTAKVD